MTTNEFTNLEAKRDAMRVGTDRLLATLGLTRNDFAGMGDADTLFALSTTFQKQGCINASLTTLKLANTARELETVTPESLDGFFAAHDARIEAERQVGPAAQELAASWTDTRTEDQRLAEFYGSMAVSDATANHSALTYLRESSERAAHDSAVANATRAAHHARQYLAAA